MGTQRSIARLALLASFATLPAFAQDSYYYGGIKAVKGGIRIGALETFDRIARHPKMAGWPLLVQAARCVGAAQIQNRGTIGGNIANASPAGDSLPVLLAYDALVHVASVRGGGVAP